MRGCRYRLAHKLHRNSNEKNGTTGTGDVVPLLTTLHGSITTHHRKHRSSRDRTKVGQHPPSPLSFSRLYDLECQVSAKESCSKRRGDVHHRPSVQENVRTS